MRWTSIIGTLLALASLGLVARVALRTSTPDPKALHEAAEAQLALGAEGDLSLMAVQVDRLLASPSLSLEPEDEQVLRVARELSASRSSPSMRLASDSTVASSACSRLSSSLTARPSSCRGREQLRE